MTTKLTDKSELPLTPMSCQLYKMSNSNDYFLRISCGTSYPDTLSFDRKGSLLDKMSPGILSSNKETELFQHDLFSFSHFKLSYDCHNYEGSTKLPAALKST